VEVEQSMFGHHILPALGPRPPSTPSRTSSGSVTRGPVRLRLPRRGGPSATLVVGVAALLTLASVGVAFAALGLPAGPTVGSDRSNGGAQFTQASAAACNSPSYTSPSSLKITLPDPVGTLAAGGSLTVEYEFAVNHSSVNTSGMLVTLPSAFATFPLLSGTETLDIQPTSVAVPTSGWASALSMDHTVKLTSSETYKVGASATLSTQKLAVMAAATYTKLTLEFRWSWSYVAANGSVGQSGWSVPTATDHNPSQLRSIFYPAPFVSFLGSSGSSPTIGTNYTATIGGQVSGEYFLLEMELPGSGKVVQAHGQTAPTGVTTYNVSIPMIDYTNSLSPGPYLIHIHDACGAMLYNKSITAVFAATATVHMAVTPSGCSAKFNGTSWSNGSAAVVTPSVTAYSISVGCAGHSFKSWSGTGDIHIVNGSSLLVSASGTWTVTYA
jgi:hypothetical protein